jgi:hypothetical protein
MPNEQWSQFTELLTAPAGDDFSAIVDKDDLTDATTGTTKRISWLNTIKHLFSSRFAADAGSTDTYVATLFPAPVAYETGQHYRFKANTANTGACTINFNGLGAKTIKKAAGGITTDLADNDIRAGQWVDLVYDGTNMQMQSLLGNAPAGGSGGIGDVVGPASATDNALARFDTTTGKLIQDSNITLPDDAAATEVGYINIPLSSHSADYPIVVADRGTAHLHPAADNNPRTFTIPANGSVPFALGTAITFVNKINILSIAITTDTLTWAEDGTTGTRSLAANGIATALKITTTEWLISGTGLS